VNATARSFPDNRRASATGAVLAGFGLSAFFFSTLGRAFFDGEAAGLVSLLAIGTGVPMLLGSIWIRAVPPIEPEDYRRLPGGEDVIPGILFDNEPRASQESRHRSRDTSLSLEMIRSRSPQKGQPNKVSFSNDVYPAAITRSNSSRPLVHTSGSQPSDFKTEYTPLDLVRTPSFYLLAIVLAILCGTGLMYINNVGTVALVLARQGRAGYNRKEVSGWQSRNVGIISIWNCLGRIGGGEYGA
jgi:hypothetical protein